MPVIAKLKNRIKKLLGPKLLNTLYRLMGRETEVERYRRKGASIGEGTAFYSVALDGCFPYLISVGKIVP